MFLLTSQVVDRLNELLPEKHSDLSRIENLSISGTHTHSGPAGFLQYVLYQITSLEYIDEAVNSF